jgi:hypothetical protein
MLQCTEGAACHRTWVIGLFRLQHRVPPAPVFVPAGRGLGLERGSASSLQSRMSESVSSMHDYLETRTVSEPAENSSCKYHVPDL